MQRFEGLARWPLVISQCSITPSWLPWCDTGITSCECLEFIFSVQLY